MRDTSLIAYCNTYSSGQAQHKRFKVYEFIVNNPNCTRQDIADKSGIPINVVCPRVKELIDSKMIFESGKIGNHYKLVAHMAVVA
ncbi:MAG: winged helix-turn-helix domain-containing protein [Bacilli bacterium]|nr:winged helix-turn-helix domain-containing protein [Bacilli bacterium]